MDDEARKYKIVYSPVRTFRHRLTGSTVTLVGGVHAAHPEFYVAVQKILDDLEAGGAVIHRESLGRPTEEEIKAMPWSWRKSIRRITEDIRANNQVIVDIGLVDQYDVMVLGDAWENPDLDKLGVAKILGRRYIAYEYWQRRNLELKLKAAPHTPDRQQVRDHVLSLSPERSEAHHLDALPAPWRAVHARRHEVAFAAIDAHMDAHPGAAVAAFWGRGHIPALSAGLKVRGYYLAEERELVAIDEQRLILQDAENSGV